MTAANGLANSFRESASVIGADVLYVSRTPWIIDGPFSNFQGIVEEVNPERFRAITESTVTEVVTAPEPTGD